MSLLCDHEIEYLLRSAPALIENFNPDVLNTSASPVKGSSVDLTVGQIFVPGVEKSKSGGVDSPRTELILEQGHTAVICTAETLRLPARISAIAFPPSTKVSLAGLLTTNPGHVDPGYCGPLHLTVINMGREPFCLKSGDRIMRLLLFKILNAQAGQVEIASKGSPRVSEELLRRLSHDFLNVDERVKAGADGAVQRAEFKVKVLQVWAPILGAAVLAAGGLVTLWFNTTANMSDIEKRMTEKNAVLSEQLAKLEGQVNPSAMATSQAGLEDRVSDIEKRLEGKKPGSENVP